MGRKIKLGDRVRDPVTGFEGIVLCRTIWLHGCQRLTVQPFGTNEKGQTFSRETFDEPQLELIEEKGAAEAAPVGGDRSGPDEREDPV
jgi:hypothetical protein